MRTPFPGLALLLAAPMLANGCTSTSEADFGMRLMQTGAETSRSEAGLASEFDLDPTDVGVALALAEARESRGDKAGALAVLVAADARTTDERLLVELARLAADPVQGEVHARAALAADPDSADALYQLGQALFRQGRHAEAVDAFERHIALRPASGYAWWSLALARIGAGRRADAIAAIETSLERSMTAAGPAVGWEAWHCLATVYASDPVWADAARRFASRVSCPAGTDPSAVCPALPATLAAEALPRPFDERPVFGAGFGPAADDTLVVVVARPGSTAASAGVRPGDAIERIGERDIRSPDDVDAALAGLSAGASVRVVVRREGVAVQLSGFARTRAEILVAGHDHLVEAARLGEQGDEREAYSAWCKAFQSLPMNVEASGRIFWTALGAGDVAAAERWARALVFDSPRDPVAHGFLAIALGRKGDHVAAAAELDVARAAFPQSGLFAALDGLHALRAGADQQARASFERAVCLGRGFWALSDLAGALDAQERARQAEAEERGLLFAQVLTAILGGISGGDAGGAAYDPNAPQYQSSYYGAQQPAAIQAQQDMANMQWTH